MGHSSGKDVGINSLVVRTAEPGVQAQGMGFAILGRVLNSHKLGDQVTVTVQRGDQSLQLRGHSGGEARRLLRAGDAAGAIA